MFVPALVLAQNEHSRATQGWESPSACRRHLPILISAKAGQYTHWVRLAICPLRESWHLQQSAGAPWSYCVGIETTAGQENHAYALSIRLHRGTPLEERGRDQLLRLLYTHDLQKWLFTSDVLIQDVRDPAQSSGADPQYAVFR